MKETPPSGCGHEKMQVEMWRCQVNFAAGSRGQRFGGGCSSIAPSRVHLPRVAHSRSGLPARTRPTGLAPLTSSKSPLQLALILFFFFPLNKEKLLTLLGDLKCEGVISKCNFQDGSLSSDSTSWFL